MTSIDEQMSNKVRVEHQPVKVLFFLTEKWGFVWHQGPGGYRVKIPVIFQEDSRIAPW